MEVQRRSPVQNAGVLGALLALGAAAVFAVAAAGTGPVARYGGAVWVFVLTWIILLPVLAPWLKERHRGGDSPDRPSSQGDRVLTALVVLASATFLAALLWLLLGAGISTGQTPTRTPQADTRGSVTIKAVYVAASHFKATPNDPLAGKVDLERNIVFAITLDTHSGDLSKFDFVKNVTLRNDRGQQVAPVRWVATAEGTHHRAGGLLFPKGDQAGRSIEAEARAFELVVRGLGGIAERVLRWTLPLE